MIKPYLTVVFMLSANLCFAESSDPISDEKKLVMDQMLDATGAADVGEIMMKSITNNMIDALGQQKKSSPEVIAAVKDETHKVFREQFLENRALYELSYPIYHKHFSLAELEEILAFYQTPTGKKMTALTPQLTREGIVAGQKHGASVEALLKKRVDARLKAEGLAQ